VPDLAYQLTRRAGQLPWPPLVGIGKAALGGVRRLVEGGEDHPTKRVTAAVLYLGFVPLAMAAELLDDAAAHHPVLFWATTAGLLAQTATVVFGRGLREWVWSVLTFAVPLSFAGYAACTAEAGLLLWPALIAPILWTAAFRSGRWLATDYVLIAGASLYEAHLYPDRTSPLVGPAAEAIRLLALAVVAVGVFLTTRAWRAEARRTAGRERRQRKLVEHLLLAHERERQRIAGELHDETVQTLAAGVFALGAASQANARGEAAVTAARLEQATQAMQRALDDARRVSFQLRPALVSHYEITEATQRMADQFVADTGLALAFDVRAIPAGLDRLVETLLYRTLSELLDNVRLHARAQSVQIRVGRTGDVLWGEVADDGRGFALRPAIGKRRTLAAMVEQFRAAGGSFRIATGERGTTVGFEFPLTGPEA
jgi:signal transduction histidine kinase